MNSYFKRQNEKQALVYLKAGKHCSKKERTIAYLILFFSVALCVLGLVFSMLPQLTGKTDATNPDHESFMNMCFVVNRVTGIVSGLFLIVQMVAKHLVNVMHIESVNAMEKFDMYVYGITPNKMIMRPMNNALLDNYAMKIKDNDELFYNTYFNEETGRNKEAIYNNQKDILLNEYHLHQYILHNFLVWIWSVFFIAVFVFAIILNVGFVDILLNVFFPSISVISIIVGSILNFKKSEKYLINTLNNYEVAEKDDSLNKKSEFVLRMNQDAIFSYRLLNFMVPFWMSNLYDRSKAKRQRQDITEDTINFPKTNPYIAKSKKQNAKTAEATAQPTTKKVATKESKDAEIKDSSIKETNNVEKEKSVKTKTATKKTNDASATDKNETTEKSKTATKKPVATEKSTTNGTKPTAKKTATKTTAVKDTKK